MSANPGGPRSREGAEVPASVGDVGILVVHGIGDQLPGETLDSLADPIVRYAVGQATRAGLPTQTERSSDGAEVVLDLGDPPRSVRWILRESWWQGAVEPPRLGLLIRWLALVAPWMLIREVVQWPITRGVPWVARIGPFGMGVLLFEEILFLVVLLYVIPIFHLLLAALLVFAWIPMIRARVRDLWSLVRLTVGDSLAFVRDEFDYRKMVDQVDRDLHGLAERVRALIIVAHSQGAAIVRESLQSHPPPSELRAVVALGAGVDKLSELRRLRSGLWWLLPWTAVAWAFAILAFGTRVFDTGVGTNVAIGLLVLTFSIAAFFIWRASRVTALYEHLPGVGESWRWAHLVASRDLVPDGPRRMPPGVEAREVSNEGSWFRDHTAYMRNAPEVVAPIVDLAAGATGDLPLVSPPAVTHLEEIIQERYARMRLRLRGRVVAVAAAFLLALVASTIFAEAILGQDPSPWISLIPLGALLIAWVAWGHRWRRFHELASALEWQGRTVSCGVFRLLFKPPSVHRGAR